MKFETIRRRAAAAALSMGLALMLSGCFLSPGRFTSGLDLRKDGTFTFSYKGEIYLLGLNQLADMADETGSSGEFVQSTCYDEEDYSERECTEEELAQQRADWDAGAAARKAEDERAGKAMAAMFGGVDPSDPDAAEEIAASLRRQHGWNTVTYKGDGLYEVDFAITSKLNHDFSFPVMEGFAVANSFVVVGLRDDRTVRINAPAFAVQGDTSSSGMLQMASIFGSGAEEQEELSKIPKLDGTFTITTDGEILANNTDEGPQAVAGGKQISWKITRRTATPPSALVKLSD